MKVRINNREITIFNGATLKDAVLAYSEHSYKMLLNGKLILIDRFGNPTEPDGPAIEARHFKLKRNKT